MSASGGNGFGGFPGAVPGAMPGASPGVAPGAPMGAAGGAFVLDVPADPSWEPFETTDTLEMDGYYCCRITRESARQDGTKSPGVFLTLEIQDEDARGKILSKFMTDPRATRSNTWFVWRNLIRSITGGLAAAQAGFRYAVGAITGQYVYIRTAAYQDGDGTRTGVETFLTKDEYEAAVKSAKHRWPAKAKTDRAALPTGLPTAFPSAAFPGMPGGPSAPIPAAAAPMVPPTAPPAAAPAAAPAFAPPPLAPAVAPVAPPIGTTFPGFTAPAAAPTAAAAPAAPQPAPAPGLPPGMFPGQPQQR